MHLGDSIFILILALVLLGPKKTAELAQQLGKLMAEFRKASNDFKYQFNEEMRIADQQEQKRKQEQERATLTAGETSSGPSAEENSILHAPAEPGGEAAGSLLGTGSPSEAVPYAISATTGDEHPVEDHPLLKVDVIPPMDGTPADPSVASIEAPIEHDAGIEDAGEPGPTGPSVGSAAEEKGTSVGHG
jgi:sec-independent protein translocase protein TatB